MTWTVFGKTPREGDFVRHELRDPLAMECFRWIADSVARLPTWVRAIPTHGVRFVLSGASDRVLVGTMVRSQDRVGREFPLVALRVAPGAELARVFPAIPLAWSRALGEARRALELGASRPLNDVVQALSEIAVPTASDARDDYARAAQALQLAATHDFHDRVFGEGDAAPHYAYHTVRVATAQAGRAQGPALVCPVTVATDATAWLELARRLLPALERPPTCLWTTGVDARLVLCLADPPPSALHAVVGCAVDSARIWPLSTSSQAARAKARTVIEPLLPPPSAPLVAVLDALTQRSSA